MIGELGRYSFLLYIWLSAGMHQRQQFLEAPERFRGEWLCTPDDTIAKSPVYQASAFPHPQDLVAAVRMHMHCGVGTCSFRRQNSLPANLKLSTVKDKVTQGT